jgi:amino acid transporter
VVAVNGLITIVINWLLGIAFALTVLFLVIGGLRYIVSGGNEESADKAKKTILHAIIGIVIVILSYLVLTVLVNTISGAGIGGGNNFAP